MPDVVKRRTDLAQRDPGERGPGQPAGGELDRDGVLLRLGTGRLTGLPVHHVEPAVGVSEDSIDPPPELPVPDQRVESHLDFPSPAVAPLPRLELRPELRTAALTC